MSILGAHKAPLAGGGEVEESKPPPLKSKARVQKIANVTWGEKRATLAVLYCSLHHVVTGQVAIFVATRVYRCRAVGGFLRLGARLREKCEHGHGK
jgi:microcystin degradation protein MlrC